MELINYEEIERIQSAMGKSFLGVRSSTLGELVTTGLGLRLKPINSEYMSGN